LHAWYKLLTRSAVLLFLSAGASKELMAMVIMDGVAVTVTNTLAGGGSSTEVLRRCQLKLVGILWAPAAACLG
jgi:hypothetical protein